MISSSNLKSILMKSLSERIGSYSANSKITITQLNSGPFTRAFKCILDKDEVSLFVKFKEKNHNDNDVKNEYKRLNELWNDKGYSNSKFLGIPEPLDYLENYKLLITKFVEGNLLSSKLSNFFFFSHFKSSEKIYGSIDIVIKWLIEYETRHTNEISVIKSKKYLEKYLETKIDDIKFMNLTNKNLLKDKIKQYSSDFPNFQLYPINTDFNPNNIIIKDNRKICVIDWEKTRSDGLSFWMPSTFLRYIRRYKYRIGTNRPELEKISQYFKDKYLSSTIFINHEKLFDFIFTLQNITYLSESQKQSKRMNKLQKNCLEEIMFFIKEQ